MREKYSALAEYLTEDTVREVVDLLLQNGEERRTLARETGYSYPRGKKVGRGSTTRAKIPPSDNFGSRPSILTRDELLPSPGG